MLHPEGHAVVGHGHGVSIHWKIVKKRARRAEAFWELCCSPATQQHGRHAPLLSRTRRQVVPAGVCTASSPHPCCGWLLPSSRRLGAPRSGGQTC